MPPYNFPIEELVHTSQLTLAPRKRHRGTEDLLDLLIAVLQAVKKEFSEPRP
ncbi:MAG: hypothetical protein JST93_22770 [Acidobacteria bacterium]|nr:hypothetical protein [Acidobacteriota bacterium]